MEACSYHLAKRLHESKRMRGLVPQGSPVALYLASMSSIMLT